MRTGYFLGILGCCLTGMSVLAEEVQPPAPPITVDAFDTAIMTSPLIAKISYRSAWEADNQPEYSYLYHMDKAAIDPTLDPALQKQLANEVAAAKNVDYGLKDKAFGSDLNARDFKHHATEILSDRADKIQVNISADELNKIQPTEAEADRLEKAVQTAAETKPKYPGINLSDF